MKKILIAAAILAASTSAFAQSGPIGYPGSNWSVLTVNPSVIEGTPEDNNILLQGKLEQGIDWFRFGDGNWVLNTFGSVGYSVDKNQLSYNNKIVPALGIKVSRKFDQGVIDVGTQLVHERRFRTPDGFPSSGTGVQVYVSYWFGWNLR